MATGDGHGRATEKAALSSGSCLGDWGALEGKDRRAATGLVQITLAFDPPGAARAYLRYLRV
jgi:hypothetical protein